MTTDWRVLPHEPLQKLEANLWFVVGNMPGTTPLKRTMTIGRRRDGGLVIYNGVTLEEELMKELEAAGEPAFLLVPNGFHRMDAARFKARYPKVKVLCPAAAKGRVAKVVAVDGTYEDYPDDPDVSLAYLDGLGKTEGYMQVTSGDAVSLCVADALFNMPHQPGFGGFLMKHVTSSSGGPRVSRLTKLAMVKDKKAFREHVERFADLPAVKRVLVAHHEPIEGDVASALRTAAATI